MKNSLLILSVGLLSSAITYCQQAEVEEAIRKKEYEKYGKPGEDKLNEWLSGNLMNVITAAEYQFPVSVTQHLVTYNKGTVKSESDLKYYINNEKKMFAMDGSGSQATGSKKKSDAKIISVYDNSNSAMLMFNLTDKTLFAMNMNAFRSKASMDSAKQHTGEKTTGKSDISCVKTGKTKIIMGYTCFEYVCRKTDSKAYTAMWTNNDVKIDDMPFMSGGKVPSSYGKATGIAGALLGIDSYNEDGEMANSMTVTEINTKENLALVTADYKRQQMPAVHFDN